MRLLPYRIILVVGVVMIRHTGAVWAADESILTINLTAKRHPIGVSMMLTDPSNRSTGINLLAGRHLQQIPNSAAGYDGVGDDVTGEPGTLSMSIESRTPVAAGRYTLALFGSTDTHYFLDMDSQDSAYTPTKAEFEGSITQGATQSFTIDYSPTPGAKPVIRPKIETAQVGRELIGSCGSLTLGGHTRSGGPVRSAGPILLSGDAVLAGDAGGSSVQTTGHSKITGTVTQSAAGFNCSPLDLSAAIQMTAASNDNSLLPAGRLVGGVLRLGDDDAATLQPGDYLVDRLELSGNAKLTASGPVRVFLRQGLDISGHAVFGSAAIPPVILSDTRGTIAFSGSPEVHATIYAPSSAIDIQGRARVVGPVHGGSVVLGGDASVEAP